MFLHWSNNDLRLCTSLIGLWWKVFKNSPKSNCPFLTHITVCYCIFVNQHLYNNGQLFIIVFWFVSCTFILCKQIINLHHQWLFHIFNQVSHVLFWLIKDQALKFMMRNFSSVDVVNEMVGILLEFLVGKMMKKNRQ